MKERRALNAGVWSGVLMMMSTTSLHQDAVGRERYIEMMRLGWVNPWITVPLAIVLLLIGVGSYAVTYIKAREDVDKS